MAGKYSGWSRERDDAEGPSWTYEHPVLVKGTEAEIAVHVWSRHFPDAEREPETEWYAEIHVSSNGEKALDHLSVDLDQNGNPTNYPGDGLGSKTKAEEACREFLRQEPGPDTIREALDVEIDDGTLANEAFEMGQEEGSGIDVGEFDRSAYTESADWANNKLPELRRMAGFRDKNGAGTYTYPPGAENEFLLEELTQNYMDGLADSMT
jgi:hypothetical protein